MKLITKEIEKLGFLQDRTEPNMYYRRSHDGGYDCIRVFPDDELFNLITSKGAYDFISGKRLLQILNK